MLAFAYPWLGLAVILPLVVHRLAPAHTMQQAALRVPFLKTIASILGQTPQSGATITKGSRVQVATLWFCWILMVIALARPQWIEEPITKELPMRDLMLAVDLSGSMEAQDFNGANGLSNGVKPSEKISRLHAVKQVLHDFLKNRQGDRVGMIFFGSAAFLQVPFTEDLNACKQLLDEAQVRMAGPQTAFGDAIGLAIQHFEHSNMDKKLLIVLTDGNDTASQLPPRKAAEIAAQNGITIYTIGVGDPKSVGEEAFDEEELKAVAESANGEYFFAQDQQQLNDVYKKIDTLEPQQVQTQTHRPKTDLFHYPLILLMFTAVLFHIVQMVRLVHGVRPSHDAA